MTSDDTGDEASAYVIIGTSDGKVFFKGLGTSQKHLDDFAAGASPQETEAATAEDEAAGTYEDDGETFTASGEDFIPEG